MHSILVHSGKSLFGIALIAGNYYFWALVWDWLVGTTDSTRFELGKQ
jgi:hypothetical protein